MISRGVKFVGVLQHSVGDDGQVDGGLVELVLGNVDGFQHLLQRVACALLPLDGIHQAAAIDMVLLSGRLAESCSGPLSAEALALWVADLQ